MAYKRKYPSQRRTYKKYPYKKRRYSQKGRRTPNQAVLRRKKNIPTRFCRFRANPITGLDGRTGHCVLINGFPQGTQEFARRTNYTYTYSIYLRTVVEFNETLFRDKPLELYAHHWLIYDKAPTSNQPSVGDIMDGQFPWMCQVKHDLKHRFQIIYGWRQRVYSTGIQTQNTRSGPAPHGIDGFKKFKKLKVYTHWKDNTTGTVGDVESGALYWACIMSSGDVTEKLEDMKADVYADYTMYFVDL
jgi:hypothetical protein